MVLENEIAFFLIAVPSLFTIINPLSTASVFLSITRGDSEEKKRYMVRKASVTAAIVLIAFALIGSFILSFFSITIAAFKIAGGILIAGIGYKMVQAKREMIGSDKEKKEAVHKSDISVIPLAIPMMSGPGAMTTAIVLMGNTSGIGSIVTIILAIIVVCLASYFIISRANIITKFLGENGRTVTDRIMGLIVMVVGVQFIINGIEGILISWSILG